MTVHSGQCIGQVVFIPQNSKSQNLIHFFFAFCGEYVCALSVSLGIVGLMVKVGLFHANANI